MARQKSLIKLEGTLGGITFVKTQDGYIAKEKTSINGDRIATDPAFERTRENNAEFGRAGKAGRVLRMAFRPHLQYASDSRMVSRLTKAMVQVIQADKTSLRGARNVLDGETELLEGFDFNANSRLATTLFAPYSVVIGRSNGELSITVPSFAVSSLIAAPTGATHFKLFGTGAEIDFEAGTFTSDAAEWEILPLKPVASGAIELKMKVNAGSTHPLFVAFGVVFLQEVNGQMYSLNNGSFNAMAVVKVSGV